MGTCDQACLQCVCVRVYGCRCVYVCVHVCMYAGVTLHTVVLVTDLVVLLVWPLITGQLTSPSQLLAISCYKERQGLGF